MAARNRFLLRKEYFGGLIYDRRTRGTDFLTASEYDLLKSFASEGHEAVVTSSQEREFLTALENKGIFVDGALHADWIEAPFIRDGVVSAPIRTYYHITFGCNLHCTHCMVGNEKRGKDELTTEEAVNVLQQLEDLGNPELRITGGEPTIRPDLFEIVSEGVRRGMNVVLNTNGVFGDRIREKMVNAGLDGIVISVDGDRETHDRQRGKGRYDVTLETIRYIAAHNRTSERKITVCLNPTVSRGNVHLTEYLVDLAIELGAAQAGIEINFMPLRPFGNATHLVSDMLSAREWYGFTKEIQRLRGTTKVKESRLALISNNMDLFGPCADCSDLPVPFDRSSCGAATFRMGLSPNGQGNVCGFIGMLDEFRTPGTREASILEIWHSQGFEKLRHAVKEPCEQCDFYRRQCVGVCNAMSHIVTGELGKYDPYCYVHLLDAKGDLLHAN